MMSLTRACLAAAAVLCFAIDPAAAQYNIFQSQDGPYTDVIITGRPFRIASELFPNVAGVPLST
jgi:hypothetical protein